MPSPPEGRGRRPRINPNQVIKDREVGRDRQRQIWESGNNGLEPGLEYPGYGAIGPLSPSSGLPNSENIPFSRYYGDAFIESSEAKLFAQSDNAQGDFIPLTYAPTKTAFPGNGWDHRRTIAAGYSKSQGLLRVQFYTDGAIYDYGTAHPVMPETAHAFRMAQSPGRFINEVLENYGYTRIS